MGEGEEESEGNSREADVDEENEYLADYLNCDYRPNSSDAEAMKMMIVRCVFACICHREQRLLAVDCGMAWGRRRRRIEEGDKGRPATTIAPPPSRPTTTTTTALYTRCSRSSRGGFRPPSSLSSLSRGFVVGITEKKTGIR